MCVEMLSVVENGLDPRAAIPVGSKGGSRVGKGARDSHFIDFFHFEMNEDCPESEASG